MTDHSILALQSRRNDIRDEAENHDARIAREVDSILKPIDEQIKRVAVGVIPMTPDLETEIRTRLDHIETWLKVRYGVVA